MRFAVGDYDRELPLVIDPTIVYSTYLGGTGGEQGWAMTADSAGNAYVAGFTNSTNFPTVAAIQSAFGGDAVFGDAFITKVSDAASGPASSLQLTQTAASVQEDEASLTLTVQRTGAVTVDYATTDGTASERSDYTTALGTLRFAAGESAKTITLLVNEDSKAEGNETFNRTLSNPTGGRRSRAWRRPPPSPSRTTRPSPPPTPSTTPRPSSRSTTTTFSTASRTPRG